MGEVVVLQTRGWLEGRSRVAAGPEKPDPVAGLPQ